MRDASRQHRQERATRNVAPVRPSLAVGPVAGISAAVRARAEVGQLRPSDVLSLQRSVGNAVTARLLAGGGTTGGITPTLPGGVIQRTFVYYGKPLAKAASGARGASLINSLKDVVNAVAPDFWAAFYPAFEAAEAETKDHEIAPWLQETFPVAIDGDMPSVAALLEKLAKGTLYEPEKNSRPTVTTIPPPTVPPPQATAPDTSTGMKRGRTASSSSGAQQTPDVKKPKTNLNVFKDELIGALEAKGWSPCGGGQRLVLYKPLQGSKGPEVSTKTVSGEIHQGSASVIGPQSYQTQRPRQALRWLSSIAFKYLNNKKVDTREVQAALANGRIYIATNMKVSMDVLHTLTSGQRGLEAVQTMIAAIEGADRDAQARLKKYEEDSDYSDSEDETVLKSRLLSKREGRHLRKTKERLLSGGPPGDWDMVRQALGNMGTFEVCIVGEKGLHAERRIKEKLGQDFDPKMLGGVKRPCLICKIKLHGATSQVRSGPYWPSRDTNIGMENYEVDAQKLAVKVDEVAATYVTLVPAVKGNTVTNEYDTDSDSDIDTV